jgi:hypothetical protein
MPREAFQLDHGAGAAVLSRPAPLLEPAHNYDPAAPAYSKGPRVARLIAGDAMRRWAARCSSTPHASHGA